MAAAGAWDQLAAELSSAATSYQGMIFELTWQGASSSLMRAAANRYVAWMSNTAAQAEQTAGQARLAVAAYEAAFAATVPPPLIAANRATLASLIATNIIGQNTAAIAATEAQYAEMWAQDAAAMYGYAGASATATRLTPFTPAPQNTNPAGTAAQGAAVTHATAAVPNLLELIAQGLQHVLGVLGSGPFPDIISVAGSTGPFGLLFAAMEFVAAGILGSVAPLMSLALPSAALAGSSSGLGAGLGSTLVGSYGSGPGASAVRGLSNAGVSASMGDRAVIGKLSVPPSWGAAAKVPEIRLVSTGSPITDLAGSPAAGRGVGASAGGVPPIGPVGSVVNAPRGGEDRSRRKVLPPWAAKPNDRNQTRARPALLGHTPSGDESQELERLRKELAEVAMERDAAARLLSEAIRS